MQFLLDTNEHLERACHCETYDAGASTDSTITAAAAAAAVQQRKYKAQL